jgi:hypothetical protein
VHHVALDGTEECSFGLRTALASAGWRIATGPVPYRILCNAGISEAAIPAQRDFVLGGGRLFICGGGGPLLSRLHLTRLMEPMDPPISGRATSFDAALPELELTDVPPVSGVGFALLRIGDACVAVGGPRGAGHLLYTAIPDPPKELLLGGLRWLSLQPGGGVRSEPTR